MTLGGRISLWSNYLILSFIVSTVFHNSSQFSDCEINLRPFPDLLFSSSSSQIV
jgi:hypothetical protein